MKNNRLSLPAIIILPFISSCRPVTASGYPSQLYLLDPLNPGRQTIDGILSAPAAFFLLFALAAAVLALVSLFLFLMQTRDRSYLYLSFGFLAASAVYGSPLWADRITIPPEFWSYPLISSLFLLIYFQLFREWARKALFHRTKLWAYITASFLLSGTLIITLLSGIFPSLVREPWPVGLLGTAVILDILVNSALSFQRKHDRSGIAGLLLILPIAAGVVWTLQGTEAFKLLPFLENLYFILPALLLPWQLITSLSLTQRRFRNEQNRGLVLREMIEDQELQKEKLQELLETGEKEIDKARRIPAYSLECSRDLLGLKTTAPLNLPEGWAAYHSLISQGSGWPEAAVWSGNSSLLFAETAGGEPLLPLLYLKESFFKQKKCKPSQLFKGVNELMGRPDQRPEKGISAAYLFFMDSEILCGTAGSVRIYLQKGEKIIPLRSEEKPVTYSEGLGIRPLTREDGKPFRLSLEKGDRLVLVSASLTDRELEVSGECYGQKSLYRVLGNHLSADPEELVKYIMKDFDDFDLGNTPDRHIYAGVFKKL
ncbi:MAG: SpoIIE family protein phosphatase [Spirochaetales bacterium]|nr:SpoIIE family protein phosphatase [Spirochaetales bacterium]